MAVVDGEGHTTCKQLIHPNTNDNTILTIHTQTYHLSSSSKEMRQYLSNIDRYAVALDMIDTKYWEEQQTSKFIRRQAVDDVLTLIENLLSLTLLHREEWEDLLYTNIDSYNNNNNEQQQVKDDNNDSSSVAIVDHFNKATNLYKAVILINECLWQATDGDEILSEKTKPKDDDMLFIQPGDENLEKDERNGAINTVFTSDLYESISAGQYSSYLLLSDIYNVMHVNKVDMSGYPVDQTYCYLVYKYSVQAAKWCERSLSLYEIKLSDDGFIDDGMDNMNGPYDKEEALYLKETMAYIEILSGKLIVDMYTQGYSLDENDNYRFIKPDLSSVPSKDDIEDECIKMLERACSKLSLGLKLYTQLARGDIANASTMDTEKKYAARESDYWFNYADAATYLGVACTYLFQWDESVEYLEKGLSMYDQMLNKEDEEMAVISGMAHTTSHLYETYLYLPDRTEDSKKVFQKNLVLHRYITSGGAIPLEEPLMDDREVKMRLMDDGEVQDILPDYDEAPYDDELLNTYQTMLDEYNKMLSELPPDGTYYEMEFDAFGDNSASIVQHDKIYEGSLHYAIGALHLQNNHLKKGLNELELAVNFLKEGTVENEVREYEDMEGNKVDYSTEMELAGAYIYLAITYSGLQQWKSSYDAYGEAMDIYSTHSNGQIPMTGRPGQGMIHKKDTVLTSLSEKIASFIKTNLGGNEEEGDTKSDSIANQEEDTTTPNQYINLDDSALLIMRLENITK